ncbi:MAG: transcriptional regulator of heat shock response [Alphaproteobacteria bacterium]|jgi:transcriptional regulator of heat shock response
MKKLLSLSIALSLAVISQNLAFADTIRLSEPVVKNTISETFGQILNTELEKVTITELATQSNEHVGKPFQVETKIAKVCQKKGCFFIAQQNEHVLRVSFKDYGFFIPTDSGGKTVLLAGELVQKEMSKEQAAHFTADLQTKSDAIKPGVVYEIVATSITIPLS